MYRVKVGRKGVIYLPVDVREKLRIEEDGELIL